MKIFRRFNNNLKSDRADSLVSAIIVFPLIVMLLVTGIDFGVFLNNKSAITNAARDGARTIAILGGNNPNIISDRYGTDGLDLSNCFIPQPDGTKKGGLSATECQINTTLKNSSLIEAHIEDITCSPDRTNAVGQEVNCAVTWRYRGLPMSSLNLVSVQQEGGIGLGFENITVGYANAETSIQS